MHIVFDGTVFSNYGQAYLLLKDTCDISEEVYAGQANGLLGAAHPTLLFLTFGLHTGDVHLTVKIADEAPPVDDSWEEIVEASFVMPEESELGLADWNGQLWHPIPLEPGPYRARYSAVNFAEAEKTDGENDGEPIERYELILWPQAPSNDRILKITREAAMYWHNAAQGKA